MLVGILIGSVGILIGSVGILIGSVGILIHWYFEHWYFERWYFEPLPSGVNKYVDSSLGADESLQEGCQVLVDVGLLILNKK